MAAPVTADLSDLAILSPHVRLWQKAREDGHGSALYYGDNLAVLRESIASESVDLVYLDPPFKSQASYNVLFRSPPAGQSMMPEVMPRYARRLWGHKCDALVADPKARGQH